MTAAGLRKNNAAAIAFFFGTAGSQHHAAYVHGRFAQAHGKSLAATFQRGAVCACAHDFNAPIRLAHRYGLGGRAVHNQQGLAAQHARQGHILRTSGRCQRRCRQGKRQWAQRQARFQLRKGHSST